MVAVGVVVGVAVAVAVVVAVAVAVAVGVAVAVAVAVGVVVAVGVGVVSVAVGVGVGMKPYLLIVLALTGCSLVPDATGVEHYHASHLTARPSDEDSLDVLQGYVRWDVGQRCSTKLAIGARLRDRGFYGPTETTTISTGCEWEVRRD